MRETDIDYVIAFLYILEELWGFFPYIFLVVAITKFRT